MPIITKIETQKNKSRVNIFVDGSFFCGLNKETAVIFGLKESLNIDENKLKSAIFESEVKSAFEKALDYISRRMHTKKELNDKLLQKGYQQDVVLKAIEKLQDYHYIDDELFAKQFVHDYSKYSKKILKEKLYQKGVSNDIIQLVLQDITNDDEFELCLIQARKYLKSKQIKDNNDKNKMIASLARKGFDFDIINKVCKQVINIDNEENNFD